MKKNSTLFAILIFMLLPIHAQTLPDSVIIFMNKYVEAPSRKSTDEILDTTTKISIKKDSLGYVFGRDRIPTTSIAALVKEIENPISIVEALKQSGVDLDDLKKDPSGLVKMYRRDNFDWNKDQVDFMVGQFRKDENFKYQYRDYLAYGAYSTTSVSQPRIEFVIRLFVGGKKTYDITSRRSVIPYKMPWKNSETDQAYYNYNIEKIFYEISKNKPADAPMKGKKLLELLVNKTIDFYEKDLYILAANSFKNEINELSSEFQITFKTEEYLRGKYLGVNSPRTFRVSLKNSYMPSYMSLQLMASKTGSTLFSRKPLLKEYKAVVDSVMNFDFIADYMKQDPRRKIDVYFFDDKNINEFNMDAINKTPEGWKTQDAFVKSERIYNRKAKGAKLIDWDAIVNSERANCGCNLRLDRKVLEKAIMFEITNEDRDTSIWYLLPDNTVLLYAMKGEKLLQYSYRDFYGKGKGLKFPCRQFDLKGKMLPAPDKLSKGDELNNEWLKILPF